MELNIFSIGRSQSADFAQSQIASSTCPITNKQRLIPKKSHKNHTSSLSSKLYSSCAINQQKSKSKKQLEYDIPNFVQYLLQKQQKQSEFSKKITIIKKLLQQKQLEKQNKINKIKELKENIDEIKQNSKKQLQQMQNQLCEFAKEECEFIVRAVQIQANIQQQKDIQGQQQYLKTVIQAIQIDKKGQFDQLALQIKQIQLQSVKCNQQILYFEYKMKKSQQKNQKIQKMKEHNKIMEKINSSSQLVYSQLYRQMLQNLKPTKYNPNFIDQLKQQLREKTNKLKQTLKQSHQKYRFYKKLQYDKITQSSYEVTDSQEQFYFNIYCEHFGADKSFKQFAIDYQQQIRQFEQNRNSSSLSQIRARNTEVMFYLKKVETQLQKKDVIITNLKKNLSEIKQSK